MFKNYSGIDLTVLKTDDQYNHWVQQITEHIAFKLFSLVNKGYFRLVDTRKSKEKPIDFETLTMHHIDENNMITPIYIFPVAPVFSGITGFSEYKLEIETIEKFRKKFSEVKSIPDSISIIFTDIRSIGGTVQERENLCSNLFEPVCIPGNQTIVLALCEPESPVVSKDQFTLIGFGALSDNSKKKQIVMDLIKTLKQKLSEKLIKQ